MRARIATTFLASSLLFIGAGCAANNGPAATTNDATTNNTAVAPATAATTPAPADIASWQTYTNAALNFGFKWPDRGTYAPRWEMKILAASDVKDGCYATDGMTTSTLKTDAADFCHASSAAGSATATDYYVTRIGESYVLLSFTKDVPAASKDFSMDDYRKQLDQIVATFNAAK